MPRKRTKQNDYIVLRINTTLKKSFIAKAERYGRQTDVLRELLQSFVDGRVTITPPEVTKEPLYVPRIED